jgi:hypothetical protein
VKRGGAHTSALAWKAVVTIKPPVTTRWDEVQAPRLRAARRLLSPMRRNSSVLCLPFLAVGCGRHPVSVELSIECKGPATRRRRSQHELSHQVWMARHDRQADAAAEAVPKEVRLLDAKLPEQGHEGHARFAVTAPLAI